MAVVTNKRRREFIIVSAADGLASSSRHETGAPSLMRHMRPICEFSRSSTAGLHCSKRLIKAVNFDGQYLPRPTMWHQQPEMSASPKHGNRWKIIRQEACDRANCGLRGTAATRARLWLSKPHILQRTTAAAFASVDEFRANNIHYAWIHLPYGRRPPAKWRRWRPVNLRLALGTGRVFSVSQLSVWSRAYALQQYSERRERA